MDGKIYNRILLWAYTRYTFPSLQELANIMAVERITQKARKNEPANPSILCEPVVVIPS